MALSIGTDGNGMQLVVDGVSCLLDPALAAADIALSMKMLCFTWASASGQVGVYSDSGYNAKACPVSAGHTVASGGHFRLGGQSGDDGSAPMLLRRLTANSWRVRCAQASTTSTATSTTCGCGTSP